MKKTVFEHAGKVRFRQNARYSDGLRVPRRFHGRQYTIGSIGRKTVFLVELGAHISAQYLFPA